MGQGSVGHAGVGTSRMFGMQKSSNSSNPMLLSVSNYNLYKKNISQLTCVVFL